MLLFYKLNEEHVVKNDGFVQVAGSSKVLTIFNEYTVVVVAVVFLTRKLA